jgi:hypothetical protein
MANPENEAAAPMIEPIRNGGKDNVSHRKSTLSGSTPQARWKEANPQKVWAHQCLRSALKRGLVIQMPCEQCGNDAEAHHDDYDKPMAVRWLCRLHHCHEHGRLRRRQNGGAE